MYAICSGQAFLRQRSGRIQSECGDKGLRSGLANDDQLTR